jgi:hypothetical protein
MKQNASEQSRSSRNLKYIHVLSIWEELSEIVGGDQNIAASLTAAFFCSQLAGSTPNPYSARKRRARDLRRAISDTRRGNPRSRSKPNRPKS